VHAMMFGSFSQAPRVLTLVDQLTPHCACDAECTALETARKWAIDFTPVAELVAKLDATRPKPSYVFGEISQTVLDNVGREMGITFASVHIPEIRWEKVERCDEHGRLTFGWVGIIQWPEGTVHGRSRFAAGNNQCHACGHRIRKNDNWVPLVADGTSAPVSLWVGRDCARHLFGCATTGDADFRRLST